ncbi:MAG: sugar ABC transporter ATP-binding protein, partial [Kiritimatiellae bacterium]|nr:sugar ABC transporter ATP-binding protein [Kiritimatiellia bacterium]
AAAAAALARAGAPALDPDAPVSSLGVADRQKTEIAKGLLRRADLLVLDEPTTVLSRAETEALFATLRELRAGGVAALYISHKLDEVLALCDEVAVLRDGALVARGPAASFTPASLAERMVGRPLADVYPPRRPPPPPGAAPALRARGLSDGARVLDASFDLFPGEILGLAGLAGAGRTELAELVCGERRRRAGALELFGAPVRFRSMREALRAGVSYLSEDRQGTGLLAGETVRANATLSSLRACCRGPLVSARRENAAARRAIGAFAIRCTGPEQSVRALSGGNQQKVSLAKSLGTAPRVLIADEPTRGVDVGARAEIYRLLHELASRGMAVLLISSDLPEILGNCRRALVMRGGRIAGELADAALTERAAIRLATGTEA